jgi:short-subunit dehydrogenase
MERIADAEECKPVNLAVVTGASSGIGKAFAHYFASQGFDMLITGRRKEKIEEVAKEIRSEYGVNAEVILADLSVGGDLSGLLQAVGSKNNIAVLVNNAGYGMDRSFIEDAIERQLTMVEVHVNAPLMLIHKVLPQMMERKAGIIINVSSLAAYFPAPGNTIYAGTKSFLKTFTESLHFEVSRQGIHVQCLCPGYTYSDFHRDGRGIKTNLMPWMQPDEVVRYSLKCLEKGMVTCVPGFWNRFLVRMVTFLPRSLYYRIAFKMGNAFTRRKTIPGFASASQAV